MELNEMAEQCLRDNEKWFPEVARDVTHHLLSMVGEAGEVCNVFKKVQRGSVSMSDAMPDLHEEMIDVLIYWMSIAALMGIDIERVYNDKRERNSERFADGEGRIVQPGV